MIYEPLAVNTPIKPRIQTLISRIDRMIEAQLNTLLHHPKLQSLESRWRGLEYLIESCPANANIKIKLLNINWQEISRDIDKALEFDQSQLFQKIYSDEFAMPGGEPFGVILTDFYIRHKASSEHPYHDLSTLQGLSQIGAAAFAPIVLAPSPALFGLDHFTELTSCIDLDSLFKEKEYADWRHLREATDSRFLVLTLPQMLMRKPYKGPYYGELGLKFRERPTNRTQQGELWGHSSFALGAVLIREFSECGWFSHIRGVLQDHIGGGLVQTPAQNYSVLDASPCQPKPQTNLIVTDQLESHLNRQGFMPLSQCYNTPFCAFHSASTLHSADSQSSSQTDRNAKISAMLPNILCGSRFAHYIKVMIRDKVGSFFTAAQCEHFLQHWLHQYTSANEDLDWLVQARYPLHEADVKVREVPGKVGLYLSDIRLRPQYQIDQLVSELRLITELPHLTTGG